MIIPDPEFHTDWKSWVKAFRSEAQKKDALGPVPVPSYTLDTLPSAKVKNQLIIVTDEIDGPILAYSDGTAWRRVMDQETIA